MRWLTLLALVIAAGCGSTAMVGADRTLTLGVSEYRLRPDHARVSQGLLTIVVHNYGKLTHNLAVALHGQTQAVTAPIAPGATADLALQLTPGIYTLASTLLSDQALGAYGTLTVTR